MIVVSGREFRANQGKYIDMVADGRGLVLKFRVKGSFKIVPVSENDTLMSKEEFYFVTLNLQNCVTNDVKVLRDFMRKCNKMWADGIRTKHKFRSLDLSGLIKSVLIMWLEMGCFLYHIIVDSLEYGYAWNVAYELFWSVPYYDRG